MIAQEKLYVDPDDNLSDSVFYAFTKKRKGDVEYIRKDAFIEKACDYFAPHILDNSGGYDRAKIIEDFKKHLED